MAAEPLLTIPEVAAVWRVSPKTVYRRIAKGHVRIVDIGDGASKTRIPESALDEYAARVAVTDARTRGAA